MAREAQAQERYQRGRERYHAGDFAGALEEFRASLELVASPNTRMYVGRALRRLGRVAEAYVALDRAARDAGERAAQEPRYAPTRDAARAEADALSPLVARLIVDVTPADGAVVVTVDGHEVPRGGWGVAMPVDPGEVEVVARGAGFFDARRAVTLAAGEEARVALTLVRAPEPPEPPSPPLELDLPVAIRVIPPARPLPPRDRGAGLRTAGVVTLTLSGVAAATGLVFLGLFESERVVAVATRNSNVPAEQEENGRAVGVGNAYRFGAYASGIAFGVLGIAGATMFYLGSRSSGEAPRVSLFVDPARNGVGLAGRF